MSNEVQGLVELGLMKFQSLVELLVYTFMVQERVE